MQLIFRVSILPTSNGRIKLLLFSHITKPKGIEAMVNWYWPVAITQSTLR